MQVIFIIGYNSLGDLTRQHEVWRKTLLQADPIKSLTACVLATKMRWNCMANMIMSVSGTVCHLILYFPVNQGLAINFPWPALKNKQYMCFELFEVFLTSSADQCFIFVIILFCCWQSTLTSYWNHFPHKASNQ